MLVINKDAPLIPMGLAIEVHGCLLPTEICKACRGSSDPVATMPCGEFVDKGLGSHT